MRWRLTKALLVTSLLLVVTVAGGEDFPRTVKLAIMNDFDNTGESSV